MTRNNTLGHDLEGIGAPACRIIDTRFGPAIETEVTRPKRHEWGPPVRTQFTTHRLCPNCGLLRITRHEPGHWPWTEWQRNGKRIQATSTPACERQEVAA